MLLVRFLPNTFPHLLGRSLYWVGVPIEIFALAHQTNFDERARLAPFITMGSIVLGLGLGWASLQICQRWTVNRLSPRFLKWLYPNGIEGDATPSFQQQGSLIICSMLGNTGFVGLAIVPFFVSVQDMSWAVLYSVTQNVLGTYGLGVLVASYYGHQGSNDNHWWTQLKDLFSVPSLWGFALGSLSRRLDFPELVESGLQASIWVVIPAAFVLMGIRLSQIHGWQSLRLAVLPSLLKTIAMPAIVAMFLTAIGITGDPRLALVLMSGMPSAFAGLILAEEYNLDGELVASSIIVSTAIFLLMIPAWIYLFD